jgi:hypothetical protein
MSKANEPMKWCHADLKGNLRLQRLTKLISWMYRHDKLCR